MSDSRTGWFSSGGPIDQHGPLLISMIAAFSLAFPSAGNWQQMIDLFLRAGGGTAAVYAALGRYGKKQPHEELLQVIEAIEDREQAFAEPPPLPQMPVPEQPTQLPEWKLPIEELQNTFQSQVGELRTVLEALTQTTKDQKVRSEWDLINEARNNLAQTAQDLETQLHQREQEMRSAVQQQAELKQAELERWRDAIAQDLAQREMHYQDQINHLQASLASANGIKRPRGNAGYPGWIANQVIDCLVEYEAPCDYVSSHKVEVADVAVIVVELEPRKGVKISQIENLSKEIFTRVKLEPDISLTDIGNIEIQFVSSEPANHRAEGDVAAEIPEPSPEQLRKAFIKSTHYFINGDTGAGKSALVNNLICLIQAEYGEAAEIIIIDPKFPDSEWVIQGQKITPQYKGYERLHDGFGNELPCALDGLADMQREVRDRLHSAAVAELSGKEKPDRKLTVFIVDEAEDLIATYGKDASEPLLSTLRVGRSTRVVAIFLGQSPMCSDYGMKKANFNNCTRFWLRENALKGMDDCSPPREQRTEFKAQIYARQKRAERELKQGQEIPPSGFYGLIKCPGMPPFVSSLPKPNEYANLAPVSATARSEETEQLWDLIQEAERELPPEVQQLERLLSNSDRLRESQLNETETEIYNYAKAKAEKGKRVTASTIKANINKYKSWDKEKIWEVFRALATKGMGEFDGTYFKPE